MLNIETTIGTFEKAKALVHIAMKFAEDIDVCSGHYVIDAKSIMGVLSLDVSKPVTLRLHADHTNVTTRFIEELHMAGII